jgi:2-polyprenyl-6-methoxyphenol hydroxylase-like FAD-dependent oxidoreductase
MLNRFSSSRADLHKQAVPKEDELSDNCDVAVVGYGPTGMTVAALLGRLGHRVIVLERYTGLYNLPRAACFDDEIMRLFQKLGIAEEIGRGARPQYEYDWVNAAGKTLVKLEYEKTAPGGWAALFMMFQPHIEAVLESYDKALPTVEVRQGVTVSDVVQDSEFVTLHGIGQDGQEVAVRARFAVGADGGNGFMRRRLCQHVDDYGFQENWLVCDFRLRRAVPNLPLFRQVCDPVQPTSIVTIGPEHHRFSFMLNPDDSSEEVTKHENVWSRVSSFISEDDAEIIRVANYTFRSRIAGQWRFGRAFLAGDAAHEMPPFLGQGMCSGIRDSHNLAWKLDLILRGLADMSLLDSYQPEREPHVRFITEKAIEFGRVQTLRDPNKARERDERFLAQRRANEKPEKIRLPALKGGLIANNGEFFPQGRVHFRGRTDLFDDVVGDGWCIVAREPQVVASLTCAQREFWQSIGGRTVILGQSTSDLYDIDEVYASWFATSSCSVAVVRPDWYVYGTARDQTELTKTLERLARSLQPRPVLV